VESTAVVPNSCTHSLGYVFRNNGMVLTNVVLVSPFEADLEIMVLCNDSFELVQQLIRLLGIQFVDELWERAKSEDALPACYRVRSDNRMYGF
jgi:hypothetical protein